MFDVRNRMQNDHLTSLSLLDNLTRINGSNDVTYELATLFLNRNCLTTGSLALLVNLLQKLVKQDSASHES